MEKPDAEMEALLATGDYVKLYTSSIYRKKEVYAVQLTPKGRIDLERKGYISIKCGPGVSRLLFTEEGLQKLEALRQSPDRWSLDDLSAGLSKTKKPDNA